MSRCSAYSRATLIKKFDIEDKNYFKNTNVFFSSMCKSTKMYTNQACRKTLGKNSHAKRMAEERLLSMTSTDAVGIYKNESLVGHVPIELSGLIDFLRAERENNVHATESGKRKREVCLLTASFSARTKNKKYAKVPDNELVKRKSKYSHFKLEHTVIYIDTFYILNKHIKL